MPPSDLAPLRCARCCLVPIGPVSLVIKRVPAQRVPVVVEVSVVEVGGAGRTRRDGHGAALEYVRDVAQHDTRVQVRQPVREEERCPGVQLHLEPLVASTHLKKVHFAVCVTRVIATCCVT